ncbi:MAG: hypothetical protein J0M00_06550, partial [Burkholderiales bacterium]|nr:hypothetical protein [Burkholderiales bacterium]
FRCQFVNPRVNPTAKCGACLSTLSAALDYVIAAVREYPLMAGSGEPRQRQEAVPRIAVSLAAKVSLLALRWRPGVGHERVLAVDRFVALWRFRNRPPIGLCNSSGF